MRAVLIVFALLAVAAASSYTPEEHQFLWESFKLQHKKSYSTAFEAMHRFRIFKANTEAIAAHNAEGHSWTQAMNEFGDMTHDEFVSKMVGGYKKRSMRKAKNVAEVESNVAAPLSVDWTAAGAVTPVKNQGQCGSCWSFSSTGAIEGVTQIKTGQLLSLSEQQLMDCSTAYGNAACNGGLMDNAFSWVIHNGGIGSEASYPYTAKTQTTCKSVPSVASITGYQDVSNSETALMDAVALQPVSVAIEADQSGFQFYSSGVFTGSCGTSLDHGVLTTGYGTMSGSDYWAVKNSWGSSWGSNGYIYLGRNMSFKGKQTSQCGITMAASYPTKA